MPVSCHSSRAKSRARVMSRRAALVAARQKYHQRGPSANEIHTVPGAAIDANLRDTPPTGRTSPKLPKESRRTRILMRALACLSRNLYPAGYCMARHCGVAVRACVPVTRLLTDTSSTARRRGISHSAAARPLWSRPGRAATEPAQGHPTRDRHRHRLLDRAGRPGAS